MSKITQTRDMAWYPPQFPAQVNLPPGGNAKSFGDKHGEVEHPDFLYHCLPDEPAVIREVRLLTTDQQKEQRMKHSKIGVVAGALMLAACSQPSAVAQGGGGTIEAINHTHWAINHFNVNGQSGIDIIGPYQGGGGGCCYGVPAQWQPGMTVRIDWETGVAYSMDFPGYEDEAKYLAWEKKINAQKIQHSKVVPVPDYTGQKTCGITVHFMPCDQVKVTTSCYTYDNPNYPIKEPIKMPEPKVCPR